MSAAYKLALVEVGTFLLIGVTAGVSLFWFVAQGEAHQPVLPRSAATPAIAPSPATSAIETTPCIAEAVADAANLTTTCISVQ